MRFFVILIFAVWVKNTEANAFDEVEHIGEAQAILLFYLIDGPRECEHHTRAELMEKHRKATECVKNIRFDSSFCSTFLKSFKPCVQPLLEETGQCDDPFMNSLKNAVVDVVMAEIRYFCDTDGRHILELVNPCVLKSSLQNYDCKTKVMKPYQRTKNLTEVCGVFPDVLKCFEDEMKKECTNDFTRKTLHDVFTIDLKPCNIAIEGYVEYLKFISRRYLL